MKSINQTKQKQSFSLPLLLLILCLTLLNSQAFATEPDTTIARDPKLPKKSIGQTIGDIPKEIVMLPLRLTKGVSWLLIQGFNPLYEQFSRPIPRVPVYLTGDYSSTVGLAGGVGFSWLDLAEAGDRFKMRALYSTHKYQKYLIDYRSAPMFEKRLTFHLTGRYERKPYERFYGLGNDSRQEDGVALTQQRSYGEVRANYQFTRRLSSHFKVNYADLRLADGEDPERLGELDKIQQRLKLTEADLEPTKLISLGLGLDYDHRDHAGRPSRGGWEAIELNYVRDIDSDYHIEYLDSRVTLRYYLELFRKRILTFRFEARSIDRVNNADANPYYLQNRLGGRKSLRGFKTGRFADNDAALASIEYRYPVAGTLDGFIFLDQGRVFSAISKELSFSDWHNSYGFGLRLWSKNGELGRIFMAMSDERSQFYFSIGQTW